jgi:hypothetical protein
MKLKYCEECGKDTPHSELASYYYFALQAYFREPKRIDIMIIDLTISAEALFSTGRAFKRNLKHRLSNLIARDEAQKIEIAKNIGSFYEYSARAPEGLKDLLHDLKVLKVYNELVPATLYKIPLLYFLR